jgi:addiction module HigA family antidote
MPGEMLRQLLDTRIEQVTQEQLAEHIGVSRFSINQVLNGRRAVTAEMALRLAAAVGTSPELWLNLQRSVDLYYARRRLKTTLPTIRLLRRREAIDHDGP